VDEVGSDGETALLKAGKAGDADMALMLMMKGGEIIAYTYKYDTGQY